MKTLYKQNGSEVKVNETSLKHALSLGWTEKKPTSKKKQQQKAS